jgi:hypothetical protein
MHKPPTSFRFSPKTREQLSRLAERLDLSAREVLERLVDQASQAQPAPSAPPDPQENPHDHA